MKTTDHTKQTIQELSLLDQSPLIRETGRSSIFLPTYGGGTFCEAKGGGALGRGVRAFTLVELIIVITILAILATIAFMSFQGYMKQSRDAVRVSDLASASKGLSIFFTKSGVYPEAESPVTITASGNTLSSQGTLGESVVRAINMNQVPLDPVDQTKYTYSTNGTKTKYQLMSYTENASLASMMTQSYAQDLTDRGIQMQGDGLGIVLNPDNSLPTASVDTYSGTENYKIVFNNDTVLEGSGNLVFSQIYNMRDDLLKNKELAKLDNALVGYWDMETLTGDLLRDWSKYENNGTCNNGTLSGACGKDGFGPQIVNGDGKTGKAMLFNSGQDTKIITGTGGISPLKPITVSLIARFDSFDKQNGLVFMNTSTGTGANIRYLFSSTFRGTNRTPANGSHIGTLKSNGEWGGSETFEFTEFYSLSRFYHIAFVVSPQEGSIRVYRNNQLIQTKKMDSTYNFYSVPTNIYIGGNGEKSDYTANGLIDEVRIYNRALYDSEIKSLYGATK